MIFPDTQTLNTFHKLSAFDMLLFNLKGKLEKSNLNPLSSSVLHTVWIRIHNVLGFAREVEIVKEITTLVAEPILVDELSLVRDEPVRVKVRCRKPEVIQGDLEFFFNGGVFLRFEVEGKMGAGRGGQGGPPPGPGKPDGSFDKDKDHQPGDDKQRKGNGKFDRFGRLDREMDSSLKGSMEEPVEQCFKETSFEGLKAKTVDPIAAFHPDFGLLQIPKAVVETDSHTDTRSGMGTQ